MRGRILALVAALILVGASTLTATAHSQAAPSGSRQIWCGLWVGASLHVSEGDIDRCAGALATQQPPSSHSSTSTSNRTQTYVALGDSVAAGLGLPRSSTATSQDVQCGRSPAAYPSIVASSQNLRLVNLACTGATAGDLVTQQHMNGPNPSAQLSRAFAGGAPALITITAGANDAHWADFLRSCYASDCTSSASTFTANSLLVLLQAKLTYAMQSLQNRIANGGVQTKVVVAGYYNPVSSKCVSSQLSQAEITWLTAETNALNQTIRDVVSHYSFATFVPTSFVGHDICSSAPWLQGLRDPAPFHPTSTGQRVIANAILETL